ncbi:hypothetical protein EMCRGX_G009466 [Ephydatia muelleri]
MPLGPWLVQVHTYPVGTWNSSESASKCFATHKNGTHLHWYTPTLWVHGTAQSLPQSALQLTRMAPISNGTHLPCGYMEQLRVSLKVLCNSQEWHPPSLVSFVLDLRVTLGPWLAQVHTYPVGTWNSSESASKCFATHKNGTHLHCVPDPRVTLGPWLAQVHTYPVGTWNSSDSVSKCFATLKNGTHLHWYTPTLWVHGTAQSLSQSALQLTRMAPTFTGQLVHTYPVGTWNSSESASKCFATHKNGTHLHWYTPTLWVHGTAQSLPQNALQLTRMAPISIGTHLPCGYMEQLRVCLKVLCNSQEWHPSPLVSLKVLMSCGHTPSVPDPRVTLGPWLAQVHTYPVGTWNSSESASKCFATHKNGTHLHWYTPTLWVHGTAQSLPQSALQLTRMAPISTGELESTYELWSHPQCSGSTRDVGSLVGAGTHLPCGYMEQLRVCLKVLCNSQEWHPSPLVSLKVLMSCGHTPSVLDLRVTLGPWLAQVHTYPVGTWNSSESASKCFATHKNGTHLHWYTPTLWVHGTAQSLPQSALQLTRMAPISTDPRVTLGPWLAQVHTYPVGTWNSSESVSKCFATLKNGTHLHWYTPTLWVHGTAQSLPQSALQLTRMAPIFTGQLESTYELWSHPQCSGSTRDVGSLVGAGTHLPCGYMEQLRVCLKVLCNSQEWHPSPLVSLKVLMSCGHTPSVPDPRVTLGPWLAQVHTYPVGTWNSSESASKCFATHKNGTHLHWYTPTLWVHGTAQSLPQSALQLTRMAPISTGELESTYELWSHPQCSGSTRDVGSLVGAGTHLPCGYMEQLRVCLKVLCNSQEWHPSPLVSLKVLMSCGHTPSVLDLRVTLGPWLAQVHTYPVGTWNSSESASKCFATHKNGTHLHWYTPTLWVHGTAQSLPQSALQLTRMAPISTDPRVTLGPWLAQVHTYPVGTWNSSESVSKCFATLKNGTHLHCVPDPRVTLGPWLAQVHTYPVGTWNSSESASKCFATHKNGTHLHWYTPTLWVHGTAQSLPQSALQLTRMAPISIGELKSTYELWSHPQCSGSARDVGSLVGAGTHLPCGYMEQLRVSLKVLCNSQEWHPSPLVSLKVLISCGHTPSVLDPRVTLGPWLAQVHTYPVGTWNSSESASKCFATHKNGTHLHWSACTHLPCGYMEQLRVCLKVLCNSQEWHPSSLVSLKVLMSCGHTPSVPDPRVTLGPWLAQVHTYPVGTWNSSESVSKCFATLKNGTHLHWYTPTLWVHGTAQSLSQSALQLTRMAPIFTGQLVHTYPVGTWNSSESASKCFATHKNGTHLHCVLDPRVTLGPWLAQVHTYPVGTWNSSESASKCFATHKNGTHLHWYTPTLWVHGTAQSLPQNALQLTRMAPISIGTHLPCGYMEQLRVCLKVLCNSQEWHPSPLVSLKVLMSCGHTPSVPDPRVTLGPWLAQVHTYPVGTWNSSESASKCFATHKNGTHLHWYTPTLWVHGTAQSLPQSALQLTRMAPISTGELESTYELWSHPQCSGSTRDVGSLVGAGTHLPCGYMEQLRVSLKVLCNSQEWHPSPLVSLKVLMSCGHTPSVQDPRVTLGPWLAQVHTYPVGTWNSSESASKCFATHKNGTHLHCVLDLRVTLGPWLAQVHTYPVGTWNSSESASKCFATHKNGTHLHWYTPTLWVHGTAQSLPQSALQLTRMAPISTDPRVTLGPWLAQVHTYPVGTWNSSESVSKCFATLKNGTHLHWYTPTLWVHGTAQSLSQSALQLTRMAPISIGTHLPCGYMEQLRVCLKVLCNSQEWHPSSLVSLYTPTLWVHGTAQSLPQSALQLTRMAPISTGELESTYELWSHPQCSGSTHDVGSLVGAGTHLPCGYMEQLRVCLKVLCNSQEWHPSPLVSLKVLMSCGHTPSVPDPRVTLGPWLAQVHTYPVGTWNSSESASKCFATHKNGTHLHW